ncbi:MAG: sulfate ABC transporter permease subunit CysW [Elusimicrobia bacterium]|nr:sulfate ABC transporter permease subunit CysW [Elusimicrobiota bacterium]
MAAPESFANTGARRLLIASVLGYLALFLLLPVAFILQQALAEGWRTYAQAARDPAARSALGLTLAAAAIAVPLNVVFGAAAAWAVAKFEFPGKSALIALIDLPLTISPVISGLMLVLVFGLEGWLGDWLRARGLAVIFAPPGIVLATLFVTLPFAARELIPLMAERGKDDEEAAVLLGADGWQTFWRVTLPEIKWGVLYGAVLCASRAIGEFGAVSVVSGHVRGRTNTLTLHVEALYNEYHMSAAFAVASLLTLLALATMALQAWLDRRAATAGGPP